MYINKNKTKKMKLPFLYTLLAFTFSLRYIFYTKREVYLCLNTFLEQIDFTPLTQGCISPYCNQYIFLINGLNFFIFLFTQ